MAAFPNFPPLVMVVMIKRPSSVSIAKSSSRLPYFLADVVTTNTGPRQPAVRWAVLSSPNGIDFFSPAVYTSDVFVPSGKLVVTVSDPLSWVIDKDNGARR